MSAAVPPVLGDTSLMAALHIPRGREIGALWRRFLAFAVDSIVIGVVSSFLVWPFFSSLSHLGTWGPLLGFFIALPYFAILDSRIGNGQTLGKRLFHIQVVDRDGNTLPFSDSTLRYAIFSFAYYLSDVALPLTKTPPIAQTLLTAVMAGLSASLFYLLLFNRHTRQGIHDLATDSFVADAEETGPLNVQPIWRGHWVILGSILLVCLVGGEILSTKVMSLKSYPELLEDLRLVEAMPGVYRASVRDSSAWGPENRRKILVVTVHWTSHSEDQEFFSDEIAKTLRDGDSKIEQWDALRIVVVRGYNLGIASAQTSRVFQRSPAEWQERIGGN